MGKIIYKSDGLALKAFLKARNTMIDDAPTGKAFDAALKMTEDAVSSAFDEMQRQVMVEEATAALSTAASTVVQMGLVLGSCLHEFSPQSIQVAREMIYELIGFSERMEEYAKTIGR